jgi:hypothetical protein
MGCTMYVKLIDKNELARIIIGLKSEGIRSRGEDGWKGWLKI